MDAHKKGVGSKYVKWKKFGRLLHAFSVKDKSEAAKLEYQIKQLERNEKITFFVNHADKV